jgi:hypothetical protein
MLPTGIPAGNCFPGGISSTRSYPGDPGFIFYGDWLGENVHYSGTSLSGHLCQEDTSLLRTQNFSPKLVISIQFDLCNWDTPQLRTAFVYKRSRPIPFHYAIFKNFFILLRSNLAISFDNALQNSYLPTRITCAFYISRC